MIMMSLAAEDPSLPSPPPLPPTSDWQAKCSSSYSVQEEKLKMISSAAGDNRAHVSIFTLQVKKNMNVTRSRVGRLTNDEQTWFVCFLYENITTRMPLNWMHFWSLEKIGSYVLISWKHRYCAHTLQNVIALYFLLKHVYVKFQFPQSSEFIKSLWKKAGQQQLFTLTATHVYSKAYSTAASYNIPWT